MQLGAEQSTAPAPAPHTLHPLRKASTALISTLPVGEKEMLLPLDVATPRVQPEREDRQVIDQAQFP